MKNIKDGAGIWPTGLIEVAPGAYAYIQAGGTSGIGNAALILGSDQAFVVDSLVTLPITTDFFNQIRCTTSLPITHVLLTHQHTDHFLGLQVFLPTRIVSHISCREEMIKRGPDVVQQFAARHPEFAEGLRGVRLCLPDQTFENSVTFYLGDREVRFFHLGYGHTQGDGLVYLPEEKVLFAGDVAFFKVTPQGFHGHIGNWIKIINRVLAMDIKTIVPGHGPIGGKAELAEMCTYLEIVYDGAKRCFDRGLPEFEAVKAIDIGAYSSWVEQGRIKDNVERAYQEFRGEITATE